MPDAARGSCERTRFYTDTVPNLPGFENLEGLGFLVARSA